MVVSSEILSGHYVKPHSDSLKAVKIAPEYIKSNQIGKPGDSRLNVASYPWGEYKVKIEKGPHGEQYAVTQTANKKHVTLLTDYFKPGHGPFSQNDDLGIESWKSAGEDVKPAMFNIIQKMPDFALIVSPRSAMYLPNKRDTPVNLRTSYEIVNAFDPNRLGYAYSKIGNMEETLRSMNPGNGHYLESVAWIDFLAKKGVSIDTTKNIGITGLGVEKGDFVAAYYPKDKGYLITEVDFYNRAKHLISGYGLSDREAVEAMKRSVLFHEFAHVLGIEGDRKSEKLQGQLQAEFYSIMAENFKGTKLGRIYAALARESRAYVKQNSLANSIWDSITADLHPNDFGPLEQIIAKFEAEGKALGKKGRELTEYVEERVKDTYGALSGVEPSYVESKSEKTKSSSRKKGLQALIETLRKEARENGIDEGEYISDKLGKSSIKYIEGEEEADDPRYEKSIDKPEYKSMKDVRGKEAKSEKSEAAKETQSEAPN